MSAPEEISVRLTLRVHAQANPELYRLMKGLPVGSHSRVLVSLAEKALTAQRILDAGLPGGLARSPQAVVAPLVVPPVAVPTPPPPSVTPAAPAGAVRSLSSLPAPTGSSPPKSNFGFMEDS